MSQLHWMKFYPKDTLSDGHFSSWSLEERGAWLTLVMHNWLEGSLPSDETSLARLLHVDYGTMRGLWSAVGSRFIPHPDLPGRLTSPRLEKEREQAQALAEKRGTAGKAGATSRWDREKKKHGKRMRLPSTPDDNRKDDACGSHVDPAPGPATASGPDPASSLPAKNAGLVGESVTLRAFRQKLTEYFKLPELILIARREDQAEVVAFFDQQLSMVGIDNLVEDCKRAAAKKADPDPPASLRWFMPWLNRLAMPEKWVQP